MTYTEELIEAAENIGCVGTHNLDIITPEQTKLGYLIGYYITWKNKKLHSGNAVGWDNIFGIGGNFGNPSLVNLYLVNKNHNKHQILPTNVLHFDADHPEWAEIAPIYHGGYHRMSPYVKKLFNRNAGIVMNSNLLIAVPNEADKNWGGTGHSCRIAKARGIPVLNLNNIETVQEILNLISQSGLLTHENSIKGNR